MDGFIHLFICLCVWGWSESLNEHLPSSWPIHPTQRFLHEKCIRIDLISSHRGLCCIQHCSPENVFRCIPTGGAAAVALYYARKGCSSGERREPWAFSIAFYSHLIIRPPPWPESRLAIELYQQIGCNRSIQHLSSV
jgi:hypothetical protein